MPEYKLFCLTENKPTVFPVDIVTSDTVGDLKKRIKDKKQNDLKDVDADMLKLWKVDKPRIKDINPHDLTNDNMLDPIRKINRYWKATPLDEYIHVFVRVPDGRYTRFLVHPRELNDLTLVLLDPKGKRPAPAIDPIRKLSILNLHRRWNDPFIGRSLEALIQKLTSSEIYTQSNDCQLCSKSFEIIQSSGTGKSRLISELGKYVMTMSFALRKKEESGFPFGDPEVYNFLIGGENSPKNIHVRCIALLGGIAKTSKEVHQTGTTHC